MKRSELIGIDAAYPYRRVNTYELRKDDGPAGGLTFRGIASTTEQEYPVFGGTFPGWMETIAAGAFKRTLRNNADVSFLVNHEGITLARTKSGTMTLREAKAGLDVVASLDPRMNAVNDLYVASERGDVDEMSFAFRVVEDEWFDDDGNPSTEWEGTKRRITEVNLNKGDVSAVNYGANDTTSGGFRGVEMALAELRDGRELTEAQVRMIRGVARPVEALDDGEERASSVMPQADFDKFDQFISQLEQLAPAMREHLNSMLEQDDIEADGTFDGPTTTNMIKLGPQTELLAAMIADLDRRAERRVDLIAS